VLDIQMNHLKDLQRVFSGFDTLLTRDITKSSATQRAGRAGREVRFSSYRYVSFNRKLSYLRVKSINRICFRLYTELEDAFNAMTVSGEPEILRCSLTSSILNLKYLDRNLEELDLMDRPDEDSGEPFFCCFFLDVVYKMFC
jgi:HrpA-like RNA helicase